METIGIKNNQIFFEQDKRVPLTNISFIFHGAGEQQETEEKTNIARLTAKMLFRGTEKYSRIEIAKKFELLGTDFRASVNETDFIISISAFTRNLNESLNFLKEIIAEVNFPQEELNLVKIQMKNKYESSLQDPDTVLRFAHQFVIHGGNRFGKIGSVNSIEKITREEILNYFEKVKSTAILYITSISDKNLNEIENEVSNFILGRNTNGFTLLETSELERFSGTNIFIFDSPNSTNDRLIWSHDGIKILDERRFSLNLILDSLGSFEGFLFEKLRNQKGWCYGAYSYQISSSEKIGKIAYYSDPSSETSKFLIPELFLLLRSFQNENDFIEKLKLRNNSFKNRFAYQLNLKYKLMSKILFYKYGIPILNKDEYCAKIDEVTIEKSKQVISEVFDVNNLAMVFYGDSKRISEIVGHSVLNAKIEILSPKVLIE